MKERCINCVLFPENDKFLNPPLAGVGTCSMTRQRIEQSKWGFEKAVEMIEVPGTR